MVRGERQYFGKFLGRSLHITWDSQQEHGSLPMKAPRALNLCARYATITLLLGIHERPQTAMSELPYRAKYAASWYRSSRCGPWAADAVGHRRLYLASTIPRIWRLRVSTKWGLITTISALFMTASCLLIR